MSNTYLSTCCPHIPVKRWWPRDRWNYRGSWSWTFEGMGPTQGELPPGLQGKWTKEGGGRKQGRGRVSAWGRSREQKRQGSKGSGHRKTWKDDPESRKHPAVIGWDSDIAVNLELFLFSSCFTYIISVFSVITSIYKWVNWGSLSSVKNFLKVTRQEKLGPGFEPRGHALCHFTMVPPKLSLCPRFPRAWSWAVQQTRGFWGRTHSSMLPGAAGHSLSVCLTQELFGRNGFEYMMFQLFKSSTKDLLFSDDTECLANLQDRTTYQKYLGPEYLRAIANMRQCLPSGE